jgi:hypothetical protein
MQIMTGKVIDKMKEEEHTHTHSHTHELTV